MVIQNLFGKHSSRMVSPYVCYYKLVMDRYCVGLKTIIGRVSILRCVTLSITQLIFGGITHGKTFSNNGVPLGSCYSKVMMEGYTENNCWLCFHLKIHESLYRTCISATFGMLNFKFS